MVTAAMISKSVISWVYITRTPIALFDYSQDRVCGNGSRIQIYLIGDNIDEKLNAIITTNIYPCSKDKPSSILSNFDQII